MVSFENLEIEPSFRLNSFFFFFFQSISSTDLQNSKDATNLCCQVIGTETISTQEKIVNSSSYEYTVF